MRYDLAGGLFSYKNSPVGLSEACALIGSGTGLFLCICLNYAGFVMHLPKLTDCILDSCLY